MVIVALTPCVEMGKGTGIVVMGRGIPVTWASLRTVSKLAAASSSEMLLSGMGRPVGMGRNGSMVGRVPIEL